MRNFHIVTIGAADDAQMGAEFNSRVAAILLNAPKGTDVHLVSSHLADDGLNPGLVCILREYDTRPRGNR